MKRSLNFYQTDNIFIDQYAHTIGIHAVGIHAVLNRYADSKGLCFPSLSLIALRLKISERQVSRGLKVLESFGIISVSRHKGQHNRYWLVECGKWRDTNIIKLKTMKAEKTEWDWKWPDNVSKVKFPDRLVTCEWGHDWGEFGGNRQCSYCGLLQSEEYYKQMGGYNLTPEDIIAVDVVNKRYLNGLNN